MNKIAIVIVVMLALIGVVSLLYGKEAPSELSAEQEAFRKEFFALMGESLSRNLTEEDVSRLDAVVPRENHEAQDELHEAHWLAERNLSDQIPHVLENLYTLLVREAEVTCLPHEMEHLELYMHYNDSGMIAHAREEIPIVTENYIAYIHFYQAKNVSKTYNAVDTANVAMQSEQLQELLETGQHTAAEPLIESLKNLPC